MSEQAQGDLLQTQRLNYHEEGVTREDFTPTPESSKLRNAGGPELLGLHARDAQVKPYLEQQNLGKSITAEHKVLTETCESGNNHRYAFVAKFGSLKILDEIELLKTDIESLLEFGINL